jgi:hypothetical protein
LAVAGHLGRRLRPEEGAAVRPLRREGPVHSPVPDPGGLRPWGSRRWQLQAQVRPPPAMCLNTPQLALRAAYAALVPSSCRTQPPQGLLPGFHVPRQRVGRPLPCCGTSASKDRHCPGGPDVSDHLRRVVLVRASYRPRARAEPKIKVERSRISLAALRDVGFPLKGAARGRNRSSAWTRAEEWPPRMDK